MIEENDPLRARLREEMKRYGLPHDTESVGAGALEMLLRHIYNNRDFVVAAQKYTIESLRDKIEDLESSYDEEYQAEVDSREGQYTAWEIIDGNE